MSNSTSSHPVNEGKPYLTFEQFKTYLELQVSKDPSVLIPLEEKISFGKYKIDNSHKVDNLFFDQSYDLMSGCNVICVHHTKHPIKVGDLLQVIHDYIPAEAMANLKSAVVLWNYNNWDFFTFGTRAHTLTLCPNKVRILDTDLNSGRTKLNALSKMRVTCKQSGVEDKEFVRTLVLPILKGQGYSYLVVTHDQVMSKEDFYNKYPKFPSLINAAGKWPSLVTECEGVIDQGFKQVFIVNTTDQFDSFFGPISDLTELYLKQCSVTQ
jgi:hypothetical protein